VFNGPLTIIQHLFEIVLMDSILKVIAQMSINKMMVIRLFIICLKWKIIRYWEQIICW